MTSLSSLRPAQTAIIGRIPLDSVRDHCAALGLEVGDLVTCRGSSMHVIVLRTAKRSAIVLEHDVARWIELAPLPRADRPLQSSRALRRERHQRS